MVLTDSTVGHTYSLHCYKVIYYCSSFIPPGFAFIVFPIIAIILHCCLSPKINKTPTERSGDGNDNFIGRELEDSFQRFRYININNNNRDGCCSWNSIAEFLLKLTIGTSQFFFGPTTIKLKDTIFYNERCIKIGNEYYKLSLYTLLPLVWCNACVLASSIAVFFAYCIIRETDNCDESLDCFIADESDTTRITNCSMFDMQRIKVKCYEVHFQPIYALSFIGGLLKFVPILLKAVVLIFQNEKCKQSKCRNCLCCVEIATVLSVLTGGFIFFCILLFMHDRHLYFIQLKMTMKQLGLSMAVTAQISAIFIYPWRTFINNGYVIEQINLKRIPDEQMEQIRNYLSSPSEIHNQLESSESSTNETSF